MRKAATWQGLARTVIEQNATASIETPKHTIRACAARLYMAAVGYKLVGVGLALQPPGLRCKACEKEDPHNLSGSVHTTLHGSILRSDQHRQPAAWRNKADCHKPGSQLWCGQEWEQTARLKSVMENRPEWHRRDRRCSASSLSSRRSMSYRLQAGAGPGGAGGHGPRLKQPLVQAV